MPPTPASGRFSRPRGKAPPVGLRPAWQTQRPPAQDDRGGVGLRRRDRDAAILVAAVGDDAVASRRPAGQRDHARRSHADGATLPTDLRLRAEQPCQSRTDGRETAKRLRRAFSGRVCVGRRALALPRARAPTSPIFGAPSCVPSLVGRVRLQEVAPEDAVAVERAETQSVSESESWLSQETRSTVRIGGGTGRRAAPAEAAWRRTTAAAAAARARARAGVRAPDVPLSVCGRRYTNRTGCEWTGRLANGA